MTTAEPTPKERDEAERAERLLFAQEKAGELFAAVENEGVIRAGVTESEASARISEMAHDLLGVTDHWHKRIVRSGPNTMLTYRADPPDRVITDDDIVYGDFGPIFVGWEADFGRTWVIGDDPDKHRLVGDLSEVFDSGINLFRANAELTGAELYAHVVAETEARGWTFGNWHCGHLVGQFPHEGFDSEALDSYLKADSGPIRCLDADGLVAHWILEVHLVDEARQIGGFYEQLLTLP